MAEPGPPISAYRPDWSPRLPTLTFLSMVCAKALPAKTRLVVIARAARDRFIVPPNGFSLLGKIPKPHYGLRQLRRLAAATPRPCPKFHRADYLGKRVNACDG